MSSSSAASGDLETYGQIVLFGDSITEQSFNPEYFGHGSALANTYTRKCDIINRGFSGYTTVEALELFPRIFPERNDNILLVVVFFGANDAVLPGNPQHVPIEHYISNCEQLLTSSALRGKVLAVTPPPIEEYTHEPDFGRTRTAQNTHIYGKALKEVCQRCNVPVADVWTAFMSQLGWKEDSNDSLPGSMNGPKCEALASFFRDGLHPIGAGYRIIYNTVYSSICEHFGHLAAHKIEPHTPYWSNAVVPKAGEMIRWCINTASWSTDEFDRLLTCVPESDRQTIRKFRFEKDQRMALGSVLLQRHFIKSVLGYALPDDVSIPREPSNRPYFHHKSVRRNDFNVSHHAGWTVLVGALESGRVGVDLTIAETLKTDDTARNYLLSFQDHFAPSEWTAIDDNLDRFAQHWALKEAYVKHQGSGIVIDLTPIVFRDVKYVDAHNAMQAHAARMYLEGAPSDLSFELHYLNGLYIAVATEGTEEPRSFIEKTGMEVTAIET